MRKKELIKMYNRVNARRLILLISIIIGYLLARILLWIFKSDLTPYMQSLNQWAQIGLLVCILMAGPVLFTLVLTKLAYKKGLDIKLANHFETKRLRKLEKLNAELESIKTEKKNLVLSAKESYRISGLEPTETPFSFHLKLVEDMVPKLEPLVKLNGSEIGYSKVSKNTLQIHLRKYANTVDEKIMIGIGATQIPFKNPYLFRNTNENIKWQCEGHGDERVIFLPTSYLPNLFSDVVYEFELKVGKLLFGKFYGKFNKEDEVIRIYLGKDIQKSDMSGDKVAVLSFLDQKITLPKPILIYRDHKKII